MNDKICFIELFINQNIKQFIVIYFTNTTCTFLPILPDNITASLMKLQKLSSMR